MKNTKKIHLSCLIFISLACCCLYSNGQGNDVIQDDSSPLLFKIVKKKKKTSRELTHDFMQKTQEPLQLPEERLMAKPMTIDSFEYDSSSTHKTFFRLGFPLTNTNTFIEWQGYAEMEQGIFRSLSFVVRASLLMYTDAILRHVLGDTPVTPEPYANNRSSPSRVFDVHGQLAASCRYYYNINKKIKTKKTDVSMRTAPYLALESAYITQRWFGSDNTFNIQEQLATFIYWGKQDNLARRFCVNVQVGLMLSRLKMQSGGSSRLPFRLGFDISYKL